MMAEVPLDRLLVPAVYRNNAFGVRRPRDFDGSRTGVLLPFFGRST